MNDHETQNAVLEEKVGEFARRVIELEPTADLFGIDEDLISLISHKAYQFYATKKFDEAEVLLRGLTSLDPNEPYTFLLLGDILLERKKFDEAGAMLAHAHKLDPENPYALLKLGEALVRVGRHAEAFSILEQAVELLDDETPHHGRASALLRVTTAVRRQSGTVEAAE